MSIQTITNAIERIQRDLNTLNRQLASETEKEATKTSKIAQIKRSITKSTSPSTLQNKYREIERLEADVSRVQDKKASISKRISEKTAVLHKKQQELYTEQSKDRKRLQDSINKIQQEERNREIRQLTQISSMVGSVQNDTSIPTSPTYHAFISHASEDKEDVVRPLADELRSSGFKIWYDEFELKVGDSLRRKIDQGLARSRFGIVILSPGFFAKNWPQYELDGFVAKEIVGGYVILPIWHKVSKNEVMNYSPTLADRLALNTATNTIQELAQKLGEVLREADK